ncbi:hypothetical protein CJ030_MR2G026850 [Morella rubra]|uniref:Uncharacterized protein n=1 Tax=Morella rubra TaxID=262757 RepID=A0A6A1WEH4_9ROSI|nr:hypothetical protein CJ030_MR2G026850 [Morella rubra]
MKLFENELTMDLEPYVLVLKVRTWVTDTYEVLVEHEPHWFLKEPPLPPLPRLEDFGLIDVPLEFLRLDYTLRPRRWRVAVSHLRPDLLGSIRAVILACVHTITIGEPRGKMKFFESEHVIDMNPYVIVFHIRAWVSDSFEISVEHTPYLYLKDPLIARPEDFSLVDALIKPVVPYPSPSTPPAKTSQVLPDNSVVDLTSDTEEED